jgi:hypothetical protein
MMIGGLEHHMQFVQSPGCNLLDALGVEEDNCCGSFSVASTWSLGGRSLSYWEKKIHWLWFGGTGITCSRLWIEEGSHDTLL